jgi:hypothetical protein
MFKLEIETPVTQTIDSGKVLAKYLGMTEEIPQEIALANGARLVLSTKRDAYYTVVRGKCSCKAGQYGRRCKHLAAHVDAFDERGNIRQVGGKLLRPTLEA